MKYFLAILAFITSSLSFITKQNVYKGPSLSDTPSGAPTPTAIPTAQRTIFKYAPKPSPISTNPTPNPTSNLNDFVYPGSQIISQSGTSLSLQSSNDPQTIINWYESRVNGTFSGRSDSITNTNGNVNALITASNNSEDINIVIQKDNGGLYTSIEITVKSY